jgi:hypothetical protein
MTAQDNDKATRIFDGACRYDATESLELAGGPNTLDAFSISELRTAGAAARAAAAAADAGAAASGAATQSASMDGGGGGGAAAPAAATAAAKRSSGGTQTASPTAAATAVAEGPTAKQRAARQSTGAPATESEIALKAAEALRGVCGFESGFQEDQERPVRDLFQRSSPLHLYTVVSVVDTAGVHFFVIV